ncbi:BTAD domain-containing putative transcriptional regulator [Nonomuraea sediminis]|uniref:BTAD domain-containing putative transcriptional regulator n=1 Tax=Nonomuraea sediminis TaxID=2835864 RepID=UPI001BDCCB58|nr:BTAD domain-containing putative transcriptional regulator [Nonomuraea sediminis]
MGELRKHGVVIDVHDNVYTLAASDDRVDAFVFTRLYEQARAAARSGDHEAAARTLRTALALWRGPALAGLDSAASVTAAAEWNERRLAAVEDRVDADLALGRHREVIAELRHLTAQYPLRERFHGQLMLALYRAQRGSEALRVYSGLEGLLRDELGTDPGSDLQQLQLRVLRQDPALDPRDGLELGGLTLPGPEQDELDVPVPRQLPGRPEWLIGREAELDRLARALRGGGQVVVTGQGGAGKSALALEAAHRADFPDGQLYAEDLSSPEDVLGSFLTALGVREIPSGVAARSGLLRGVLASRRVLVFLDGVLDADQVRPFLLGDGGSAVLATSRSPLALLPGTSRVAVPPLSPADAGRLLVTALGGQDERIGAEPEAADRIVELCAGLPIALRIAAAKLAARPHWPLRRLADRLGDPATILDTLRHDGQAMRPTLRRGYEALSPGLRALVRAIGWYGEPEVSTTVAAALIDVPVDAAETSLAELAEQHFLITQGPAEGGGFAYRCHELLLGFAAERAAAEDPEPARTAAVERALGTWLTLTDRAHAHLRGRDHAIPRGHAPRHPVAPPAPRPDHDVADAVALERVAAAVRRAARAGLDESCWELAIAPLAVFEMRACFDLWLETHEVALACVRDRGNRRGEAALLYSLGERAMLTGDTMGARELLNQASRHFTELGDRHGRGLTLRLLGDLDRFRQDWERAHGTYLEAAGLLRECGDPVAEADAVGGLALVLHATGETREGREHLERALELCRQGGCLRPEVRIRWGLAVLAAREGNPEQAYPELLRALEIATRIGDRLAESDILLDLGTTGILLGDPQTAYSNLVSAEKLARTSGLARIVARARMAQDFLNGPLPEDPRRP